MEGQKGTDGIFILRDEHEVKLDLDAVNSYSFYPGMIVGLEGNNSTGGHVRATCTEQKSNRNGNQEKIIGWTFKGCDYACKRIYDLKRYFLVHSKSSFKQFKVDPTNIKLNLGLAHN